MTPALRVWRSRGGRVSAWRPGVCSRFLALSHQKAEVLTLYYPGHTACLLAAGFGSEIARNDCPEATFWREALAEFKNLPPTVIWLLLVAAFCHLLPPALQIEIPFPLLRAFLFYSSKFLACFYCFSRFGSGGGSQEPMIIDCFGFFHSC